MQNNTVTASIVSRSGRKFWYIRTMFFNFIAEKNEIKEESTKVLKVEKSKKWMEQNYVSAYLLRFKSEMQNKQIKNESFEQYAKIFLQNYEKNHDYQNVAYRCNRILADFGTKNIKMITKLDIKQWLNSLIHAQTGAELSKNSKLKYLRIFHGIFQNAEDDKVLKNFTFEIKIENHGERNANAIKPFLKDEVLQILQTSKNSIYGELLHYYLGIAFNQGMSPAEILGLQVRDINFDKMEIKIERNLTKGKIKETKTAFRDRVIPLFSSALPHFQTLVKLAYVKKSLWLFSNHDGMHLTDVKDIRGDRLIVKNGTTIKKNTKWYELLNDLGLEYRDLKNCRHTFAVSAIESKAFTMQEIANILGHSDLQMLIKHYAKYVEHKAIKADRQINLFSDTSSDSKKQSDS